MKKILEIDPSHDQARKAIRRLEPLAAEKREKMKEEMIGESFLLVGLLLYLLVKALKVFPNFLLFIYLFWLLERGGGRGGTSSLISVLHTSLKF